VFKGLAAWTAVGRAAQNTNNKAIHPWSHGLLWKAKGVMKDGQTKKEKKVGVVRCKVIGNGVCLRQNK
jgi:hypothetical protein